MLVSDDDDCKKLFTDVPDGSEVHRMYLDHSHRVCHMHQVN